MDRRQLAAQADQLERALIVARQQLAGGKGQFPPAPIDCMPNAPYDPGAPIHREAAATPLVAGALAQPFFDRFVVPVPFGAIPIGAQAQQVLEFQANYTIVGMLASVRNLQTRDAVVAASTSLRWSMEIGPSNQQLISQGQGGGGTQSFAITWGVMLEKEKPLLKVVEQSSNWTFTVFNDSTTDPYTPEFSLLIRSEAFAKPDQLLGG